MTPFGQQMSVRLFGSAGVLHYDLLTDRILGTQKAGSLDELREIPIPPEKARTWQVEADFVHSIREGAPVTLTDFATGVEYMEFTEAVARSARTGVAVGLPLDENDVSMTPEDADGE
jgi:hypothetical protein